MWGWLNSNAGAIGVFLGAFPVLGIVWGAWNYIRIRRAEYKRLRFETYHRLIKELVEATPKKPLFIDRQIVVVYELRNFQEYFEVSARILEGSKEFWKDIQKDKPEVGRLLQEMALTIDYIKKYENRGWRQLFSKGTPKGG